jgi:hypothetical protein
MIGDAGLLRIELENLLSTAWKFTSKALQARIEFGCEAQCDGGSAFFVRDNGADFDPRYADKLFAPLQRLHSRASFPEAAWGSPRCSASCIGTSSATTTRMRAPASASRLGSLHRKAAERAAALYGRGAGWPLLPLSEGDTQS